MRAIGYERVRALTIRSTYVFPLVGLLIAGAVSVLFVTSADEGRIIPVVDFVGQAFSPISALFITIGFAQAFGHEYRDGTMRLTLTALPNRTAVFVAKLVVPAVVAVVATLLSIGVVAAIASVGLMEGWAELPGVMLRGSGFIVMWGLLVAAVTVISRNLAAGVAGVFIWALVIEQLLAGLLGTQLPWLVNVLPVLQGTIWLQSGQVSGGLVMLAVAATLTAAAYLRFTRSDA